MEKRLTSARAIILETLKNNKHHLTAYDIYEKVKPKLPSINKSTVYRGLDYLTEQGFISVSDLGLDTPVYEAVSKTPHHHLVCQECGTVVDMQNDLVEVFFESVSQEYQYEISTNHLILFGICADCQPKT